MQSLPIVQIPDSQSPLSQSDSIQGKRGAYAFISLGCPKNLVDSEQMLGILQQRGYQLVQNPEESDFVVINTCGFIENARKESFEAIDQMLELKRSGKIRGVVITGCLAERQNDSLLTDRPEIDGLVGVFGRDEIGNLVDRIMDGLDEQRSIFRPAPIRALSDHMRLQVTPKHFAYLKISEGCDRLCTFCAIPKMRGKHASKPMEDILIEARRLADSGVRELIVVAQDTTYYGIDMFGEPRLRQLLEQLDQVEGLDWIRLMYFYPMYIDRPLLETIGQSKRILPYIDMPLQHASNPVLKRMSRRVTRESTIEMVSMMRQTIPELVLRTTMITGFPGETDEQFEELVEFVDEMHFERLGVFTYSVESDTPASRLDEHLPERIKKERRKRLMEVQQKNAFEWCAKQQGKRLEVLLDKPVDKSVEGVSNSWIGRSYADAPDVDACVFVTPSDDVVLKAGDLVECEIVSSNAYDLVAVATKVIE
ncbi:MAG: 30S ribosomal protein S12 methylthiotransferase RimO [Planctomycetota bacterium]|nr:MAG: 30S ribosomal protein S12 methylthiotransferase RimO [Planctomycetota bacterium]